MPSGSAPPPVSNKRRGVRRACEGRCRQMVADHQGSSGSRRSEPLMRGPRSCNPGACNSAAERIAGVGPDCVRTPHGLGQIRQGSDGALDVRFAGRRTSSPAAGGATVRVRGLPQGGFVSAPSTKGACLKTASSFIPIGSGARGPTIRPTDADRCSGVTSPNARLESYSTSMCMVC